MFTPSFEHRCMPAAALAFAVAAIGCPHSSSSATAPTAAPVKA